ncbi:hypothetical protein ACIQNG_34060 [Streptomyces sp. NPDC091377]|uniref:hypothetical protein n=1 Tax=Streptomyces sp. NPDC091377 TaxID=3365995 RepID=UPI003804BE5B
MRFLSQSGDQERIFDFIDTRTRQGDLVEIEAGIQQWLARVFTRKTSVRSGVTRLGGAAGVYRSAVRLAQYVSSLSPSPQGPKEITPAHMQGLWEFCGRTRAHRTYLEGMRSLLRDDPDLPVESLRVLFAERLPESEDREAVLAYSDEEMQRIITEVRGDVRRARDRVRAGRALLNRFRSGTITDAGQDLEIGRLLDHFDRTGDLPRYDGGALTHAASRWGGMTGIGLRLCLTVDELTAFCLLLTALTTENFGTVAAWPAVHYRPDGGAEGGIALVESVKPRRGPDREHMVTPLEDLPSGLGPLLQDPGDDLPLFRSPLRVYRLLLELSETSRHHGEHTLALSGLIPMRKSAADRWAQGVRASYIGKWAVRHGFPTGQSLAGGPPPVEAGRIRQPGIEHTRRPAAHTRRTMNDYYLKRSPEVQRESRTIVGEALRTEVTKARARRVIPVVSAALVAKARTDLVTAAAEADVPPEVLRQMIDGRNDTAATACTDHRAGPHTPPGKPCNASFLACLDCENARALPHQLPVQIELRDRLAALRSHMDPDVWRVRFERPLDQLCDVVSHYSTAEQEQARRNLTGPQRQLVDDLAMGRLDLR